MRTPRAALESLHRAAQALLAAREADMLTAEEWDALQHAVETCGHAGDDGRSESFSVEHGDLVRRVVPRSGDPYQHRCPADGYISIAEAIDVFAGIDEWFVLEELRAHSRIPWSQAAVAFAFMKERGVVVPAGTHKRHKAASASAYEDALAEYHALRAKGPSA